jgi:serine/threonine-protein kinase
VRVIDYGGMGAVYLAEREGDFTQRVAIKLTHLGLDTPAVLTRFVEERQILARLEHPNIARLLDGGITPGGRPYFAMEYVEGDPLTEYCAARQLDLDARLRLFLQICRAVQYAHQNLVVHRDLKPPNILVTQDGQAKLLDFGIAKLLAQDGADERASRGVMTTQRWFTPEYAAPEQVRGGPITTATDIYALGLILYELLTGQRAHRVAGATPGELERIIVDQEPERPSALVSPTARRRQLTGDLDTIVLKALQKEPVRRYASAEQLAEDIERHQSGLPVRARPGTLRYRTTKFIRRHRYALLATSVIAITLVGGIAATSWQARAATEQSRVARDERVRARLEAARAEQVSAFLVDIFRSTGQISGDSLTVSELVERGRDQIERQLSDQPAIHASMLDAIGRIYRNLGRYDEARQAWEQALALRRRTLGPHHPEVAGNLTELGKLHHRFARYDLAEPLLQEALSLWRQHITRPGADLATTLSGLADVHLIKGDNAQAERFYQEALETRRRALGPDHEDVASDMSNLATLYLHTKPETADSLFSAALALQRKRFQPGNAHFLEAVDGLAAARYRLGKLDDALALHLEALTIRRRQLGEEHIETAFSLENLAQVYEKRADLANAERYYRDALTMKRKLFPSSGPPVARTLVMLGRMLHASGRCREAQPLLREALDIRLRVARGPSPQLTELRTLAERCPA